MMIRSWSCPEASSRSRLGRSARSRWDVGALTNLVECQGSHLPCLLVPLTQGQALLVGGSARAGGKGKDG